MSFLRIAGVAAFTLLAVAASASAATPTSPAGTIFTGTVKGHSEAQHVLIHKRNGSSITCESSSFEWAIESHGPTVSAKGPLTKLSFGSCGGTTVSVLKPGLMEVHLGNPGVLDFDEVTWSGFEITVAEALGPDCRYFFQQPTSIVMGGLTASSTLSGKTATLHLQTNNIPVGNSILCPQWIQFTGAYTITAPDYLDFD